MSASKSKQVSWFSLEGQFLRFAGDAGYPLACPKALWLETSEGIYLIKLPKDSRISLGERLRSRDRLQVSGTKKLDLKKGTYELKAEQVTVLTSQDAAVTATAAAPASEPARSKAKILICQKSSCLKRGAVAVQQAIETTLRDRDLQDQVFIKGTGCMDCCKQGPTVVFMPAKQRYSQVTPTEIPALIEQHWPSTPA